MPWMVVVNVGDFIGADQEKTVGYFIGADQEKTVGFVPGCLGPGRSNRTHEPINGREYIEMRLDGAYQGC
ncbi:Flavonol synthase flavanone 3-hydroxylase [Colletotrichum higginsianum IMI 349063]|uniref:Flavonol synthase flavanone 3-hydroxylase n=1 Tax=Colletotrichum higginsianum (strain IMI 349063) TaxID=759273 RepID=A0A1B7Y5I3_COLHI|nr:Flavonol synthase flavanone 3-hydroxylase [Colletotrichum higginsianum IMI 349063]OBR07253.1 Flavonol synthase flavanone 3-hydroxylase [Colletotrichum higginsianum IMI 349063]